MELLHETWEEYLQAVYTFVQIFQDGITVACLLLDGSHRRVFYFLDDTHTFWGEHPWGTTHPPNPPSSAPTQTKRVPICSFLNSASICILIRVWNWSVAELWGKNWDTDAHAHMTYQAPTTGLHSPTLLPFLQNSNDYFMLAQSCKFGVNCCSIGLTHPAACTWRVCLWHLDMSTDPHLNPICKKGCKLTGLELRIPTIYLQFGNGPEENWRPPPPKKLIPRGTNPPHPLPESAHIYTNW